MPNQRLASALMLDSTGKPRQARAVLGRNNYADAVVCTEGGTVLPGACAHEKDRLNKRLDWWPFFARHRPGDMPEKIDFNDPHILRQKIASAWKFLSQLELWRLTRRRKMRTSQDLFNRMQEMSGIFAGQGFPELAAEMTDALSYGVFSSDIYSAVAVCAHRALKEPGLDASTRAKLKTILKMMRTL